MKWLAIISLVVGCIPPENPPQGPTTPQPAPRMGGQAPGATDPGMPPPNTGDAAQPAPTGDVDKSEPTDPMRQLEADIVAATNRLRADPPAFADELRTYRSYYDSNGYIHYPGDDTPVVSNEGVAAVDEAIRAALKASPADQMTVSAGLSRAAREHAVEIGQAGTIDHVNSKMEQPHHRMERYGVISGYSGENIGTGDAGGDNMVIGLFVDDGVPSRGHRTNMLTKAYRKIGVGCAPHIHWRIVCVIDMAEGYRER